MTPMRDLRAYATAFDRFADAAEAVADALHDSEINAALAFMHVLWQTQPAGPAADRRPEVLICDECVSACVTVLEDELGPGWRERHDSD